MSDAAADRDDVAGRLAFLVGVLNRRLRHYEDGLTHVSVSALASIARAETIRPGDLARTEGIGAPSITRLLADLELRGLVARTDDPDDRRATRFHTTSAGDAALERARHGRALHVEALLADANADDVAAIVRTVEVLETALDREALRPRDQPADRMLTESESTREAMTASSAQRS